MHSIAILTTLTKMGKTFFFFFLILDKPHVSGVAISHALTSPSHVFWAALSFL